MAAASQRSFRRTLSWSTPETERCTHVFEITGYSMHKSVPVGDFISSATFAVGGHGWSISYLPNGDIGEDSKDYFSVYLELMTKTTDVTALFDLRLLDQATGLSEVVDQERGPPSVFDDACKSWGFAKFMKKSDLETSPYLKDDRIVIECDITEILGPSVSKSEPICDIRVPPSDVLDTLGKLLQSEKRSDVMVKVEGEVFHAHKFVLAMRSPVFEAELYGLMEDKRRRNIVLEDIQPAVFKALLYFIDTDLLPAMDDLRGDENQEMIKHLLVAADRYAMLRLKVMCESILAKRLDVESVATTLALADQHHCSGLKDARVGFINSSNRMNDVMASQGYKHLKRACPAVTMELLEQAAKSREV